jgi:hypothetical protein
MGVLALCNLPKAVMVVTEETSKPLQVWIYPSKIQRGISLSDIPLFEKNIRPAMQNMGLFMDFKVGLVKA